MSRPHRIAIVSTASGCGKTTVGRALADRLGARFVELDSLVHGPGWNEASDADLRSRVRPLLEEPCWVVDGNYRNKLGDLVIERADLVVWLDLPMRVWLPRLVWRTARRAATREELWNGNRESPWNLLLFWSRSSVIGYALHTWRQRRAAWPTLLEPHRFTRLRTSREVTAFLADF